MTNQRRFRIAHIFLAVLALALFADTATAQQIRLTYPSISSPRSDEDCDRFDEAWSRLLDEVSDRHQQCLDQSRSPQRYTGSSDPDTPVCSHEECQYLHDARRAVKSERARTVAMCHEEVRAYLAQFQGCIPGCKRWNWTRGLGGEPVCAVMIYCPANRTTIPDGLERAPVVQPPR
jgi:hypothetical protein